MSACCTLKPYTNRIGLSLLQTGQLRTLARSWSRAAHIIALQIQKGPLSIRLHKLRGGLLNLQAQLVAMGSNPQ